MRERGRVRYKRTSCGKAHKTETLRHVTAAEASDKIGSWNSEKAW